MKNNKGITLISLIVYVIAMTIVVSIISTITSFFYKNINVEDIETDTTTQFTKFSSIFTNEINMENNIVIDYKTYTENDSKISYIIFSSGNQYTFKAENKAVYKNNIKICENIDDCDFSSEFVNSKYSVRVNFKTRSIDMTGDNAIVYNL